MQTTLDRYCGLIRAYAGRLNLVGPDELAHLEERHVADSLRVLPLLSDLPPGPCCDVGSGAGFPGIPLAIAAPDRTWRLIEPRTRRAAFLEEAVRTLELDNVEVVTASAEEAAGDPSLAGVHVLGTARALAPPAEAVEMVRPLIRPQGLVVLFVGANALLPQGAEMSSSGLAIVRNG